MHISPPGAPTPLISITDESMMAVQNNSYPTANGDDDIGVGNKLNFYPAVDEDYETRRAEQQTESLIPLKEDLAEWIQRLLDIPITTETFLQVLDNGAALCRLAFLIQSKAEEASREGKCQETIPRLRFRCRENAKSRTWYARDNTANFLRWCRDFGINEGCMFESEDLVCHRQEKPVVVCLLELARLGYRFGLEPPSIIKIEKEIEREESELASQLNDDDPQDEAEAEEVGAGSEAGDGSGDDEEESEEGKGKKGRERGGSDSKEKEDVKENGQEEEADEEGEEEENEKSESVDGTDGNVGNESTSDGRKSRTTSRATSHVSGQNDNEENGEVEDEDNEDKDAEGEEEKDDVDDDGGDKEDGEGVNGTMNGTSVDENANEEDDKESSSGTKGGFSRPNSPTKTDSGTTSPTRRSPTSSRSRIDKIKARQLDKKLLKEKHLMVRVGGGWDTLDHYLSHHSPTKILEFKRNDQVKTPTTSPKHDPDTGETAATNNTSGDEKYLVISGKYKRN